MRHLKLLPLVPFATAFVAAASLLTATLQATVIAYEGFDILSGSLQGMQGSGTGTIAWQASTWNNTDNTWSADSTSTLSYGSLQTAMGKTFSSGPGNQQSFRSFGSQSATGTYWMAFLTNRTTGNTSSSMGISLFDGGSENTFVGQAGQTNYGFVANFGGNFQSTTPVLSGESAFLLARYVMDGNTVGQTSIAHYWVNPNISSQPSDASAANGAAGTNFRAFAFDSFRLGSFGSQGVIDELRLGTTFVDVAPVPEPSSILFAGVGLLALVARHRSAIASRKHS